MPEITTIEMHTGGEPVRIVVDGYPPIEGATILDKRRHVAEHLDHLRRLLMLEPRGHNDMYGVLVVEPDHPDADMAVLFMHNNGYSTMCGHATIALGRYAVDRGIVPATEPETIVRLQVPSGLVTIAVEVDGGETGAARYSSVPSFLAKAEVPVAPLGLPPIVVDVAYGGAFYALASAVDLGRDLTEMSAGEITAAGSAITTAVNAVTEIRHPDDADLGFLYGTIITDGKTAEPSTNVCVFANAQVDRSPTGSGVQARMAAEFARGTTDIGEERRFRSIVGSTFTGRITGTAEVGDLVGVIVEVGGRAFYTGENRFSAEDGDDLLGFVVAPGPWSRP